MRIDELIYLQNPWLRDSLFLPREYNFPKRNAFSALFKDIAQTRQIISITGIRRVGKSTLLKQIIAKFLKNKESPKNLFYFSFDQPTIIEEPKTLEKVINFYFNKILNKESIYKINHQVYLFFDEIQLVPYWQDILKRFYDLNLPIKFVVSGSSSLFLTEKSKESLAGRIFSRYIPPLFFSEYEKISEDQDINTFLDFGQFPELLTLKDNEKKIEYLKEGVIGKVLNIDIVKTYGIRKTVDFERLFWALLPNTGQIIESRKLIVDLAFKKATLFKYLSILEKSLLINKVLNLSGSFRSEKRLLRKLYPASSNFLSLIPSPISIGFKAETYVAQILREKGNDIYLLHTRGKEIDFLIPSQKLAIEVKYQNNIHPQDCLFLEQYIAEKNYQGIIVTKNYKHDFNDKKIKFIPLEDAEQI